MPLPTPQLDNRSFQDIFAEARSRIPRYCPEWTDHNLSDPGITLLELFAWMTELILFRLNQVPDKNYIKFLEMMGIKLLPPRAARVDVTFRLSATQSSKVTIPAGTEVATVRTETEESIVFTTDSDLVIDMPTLVECLATSDGKHFDGRMAALDVPEGQFLAFEPKPRPNNALLLGLKGELVKNLLVLDIDCDIEGIGVSPDNPPLAWEAWCGEKGWSPAEVIRDTTGGLNRHGIVELILPPELAGREFGGKSAHAWLQCRVTPPQSGQPFYERSPRIKRVVPRTTGGNTTATHAMSVKGEILGISDGNPGQSFQLRNSPILVRGPGETLEVVSSDNESFEAWQEVEDFADSGSQDKHFVCDSVIGTVAFGPAIRQPDGTIKQYGAVPPKGIRIRFSSYKFGGGVIGNIAAGTLTVLKSSIPYVSGVTNRRPAQGGADGETLERAKLRAPTILRARHRAVTAEDFEVFTLEASSAVSRAKCLGSEDSEEFVTVCVVPPIKDEKTHLTKHDLVVDSKVREEIQAFLNQRCLLTITSKVEDARYIWVTVEARIKIQSGFDMKRIQKLLEKRLYGYLNPFTGGPRGQGWPFGRDLSSFELYSLLHAIRGVEAIDEILFFISGDLDEKLSEAGQHVEVPQGGLICSGYHNIEVYEAP